MRWGIGGWGGVGGYRRRSFAVGYFETVIIQQFTLYLPFCCQVAGDCVAVAFQEELRPKSQKHSFGKFALHAIKSVKIQNSSRRSYNVKRKWTQFDSDVML